MVNSVSSGNISSDNQHNKVLHELLGVNSDNELVQRILELVRNLAVGKNQGADEVLPIMIEKIKSSLLDYDSKKLQAIAGDVDKWKFPWETLNYEEHGHESCVVTAFMSALYVAANELLEENQLKLIQKEYDEYAQYINRPETQNNTLYKYNKNNTLLDNKKTALGFLDNVLVSNKTPKQQLYEIQCLINTKTLDVLSKADSRGERFLKGIQTALNPLLKTFGIQLWKDRLKEIKALRTVSPLIEKEETKNGLTPK